MRKMKWLFPLLFGIALAGSAFTRLPAKATSSPMIAYYEDPYGYCDATEVDDPNCTSDFLNYICYEDMVDDGTGWTVMYQMGFTTTCWQPYYSYYSNYP